MYNINNIIYVYNYFNKIKFFRVFKYCDFIIRSYAFTFLHCNT